MKSLLYSGRNIRTYSGKMFDVFAPNADLIDIQDIAHALSNQCRFGGHTSRFYSVAQHSLAVAGRLPKEQRLAGLLHDAAEAYLVDIPTPIKRELSNYAELEDGLLKVIASKFGFEYPFTEEIKTADKDQLEWEWENIVLTTRANCLWPYDAKHRFIQLFKELTNG